MRDRVVKGHDSLCEKIGDRLWGVITIVSGFIRLSQEVADDDRQMVGDMFNGDIPKMTYQKVRKEVGGGGGGHVMLVIGLLTPFNIVLYVPSKTPVNVQRRPCTSSWVTT